MEANEIPPITIERARRSLPYWFQVLLAVGVVLLLSITAVVFLSASNNQDEVINELLERIHDDGEERDNRVVCLLTVVIEIPPEDRTPAMVEACNGP